jgi:acyl carrier protein
VPAIPASAETETYPAVQELLDLPRSERRDALEALIAAEFRATLLMTDDEELPLDTSYFELGFTSLRITEVKQRLEELLGRPVSTTLLFNSPTVNQLLDHLGTEVFPQLFAPSA